MTDDQAVPLPPEAAEHLARARQQIAHEGIDYVPPWDQLTDHEREMSVIEVGNWIKAARLAGLLPDVFDCDLCPTPCVGCDRWHRSDVTDDQAVPPPADAVEAARGMVADTAIALQNAMESITAGPRERQMAFRAYAEAWHALADAIAAQAAAAERECIRQALSVRLREVVDPSTYVDLLEGHTDGH